MDLEDLFRDRHNKKNWSNQHGNLKHEDNHYKNESPWFSGHDHKNERSNNNGHAVMQNVLSMLKSYPHKKALLAGVIVFGIIILIVCLFVIWALFPLIMKGIYYVGKNGLQGLSDFLLQALDKILKGNG